MKPVTGFRSRSGTYRGVRALCNDFGVDLFGMLRTQGRVHEAYRAKLAYYIIANLGFGWKVLWSGMGKLNLVPPSGLLVYKLGVCSESGDSLRE